MITWIQIALQKHHKIVFGILLIVIIIAFVFTIGAVPFFGDSNRAWDTKKNFYGFDLSNYGVVENLRGAAFYEAMFAEVPVRSDEQLSQLVMRKAYLLSVARDLGMSAVSEREVVSYVHGSAYFAGADGKFSEQKWQNFKQQSGIGDEKISAIISQNALTAKVAGLLGGPGYVLRSDLENQYDRFYGKYDFSMIVLPADSVKLAAEPSAEALEQFYKDNAEAYRVGEGFVLQTAYFPVSAYAAAVATPTDAQLSAFYTANMRSYIGQKDGKAYMPELAEIKDRVKADYLMLEASRLAAKGAEEFAMKIYDSAAKFKSPEFAALVKQSGVELKTLPAIRKTDAQLPEGVSIEVATAGVRLDESMFYSDPISTKDGAYVVVLSEKLNSFVPPFADVKEKVAADYIASEKAKLFAERGKTLDEALKAAVAAGKPIDGIAAEAGAKVEEVKDFSPSSPANAPASVAQAYSALGTVLGMKAGTVSNMHTIGQNGYIFYLSNFVAPQKDAEAAKINEMLGSYMKTISSITSNMVVGEMVSAADAK